MITSKQSAILHLKRKNNEEGTGITEGLKLIWICGPRWKNLQPAAVFVQFHK